MTAVRASVEALLNAQLLAAYHEAREELSRRAQELTRAAWHAVKPLDPRVPPELRDARFVQMGEFWERYDELLQRVESGDTLILQKKTRAQAIVRRANADDADVPTVSRRELFRKRSPILRRVARGATLRIEGTGVVIAKPGKLPDLAAPLSDEAIRQREQNRDRMRTYRSHPSKSLKSSRKNPKAGGKKR